MVDLVVTAVDVALITGNSEKVSYGATITQGQSVYLDTTTSTWKLAQADGTAAEAGSAGYGMALSSGASGQEGLVMRAGTTFDPGATPAVAEIYVISATAGGVAPVGDLVSTDKLTIIGYGNTAGNIVFLQSGYTGESIP